MSFAIVGCWVSSPSTNWSTWWRHAMRRGSPCCQGQRWHFPWMSTSSSRSRGRVRRGFRRNGPLRVVGRSVRRLRLVRPGAWKARVGGGWHRGVLGGAPVVDANLFLIFPNDVFSGWSGSGRLIVHTKAVVPTRIIFIIGLEEVELLTGMCCG